MSEYSENRGARRGSALLIVLGMLAFMIISGVAFSSFMRFNRMPSSFLRRSSASRLLVKAGLANAIDQIDLAIGNNPHPGIGTIASTAPRKTDGSSSGGLTVNRNIWMNRVFFGTNNFAAVEETVSPLTLEGLAYIPPALVNETRYLSRYTPSACWKSLGFDAGRYAYVALDVSDFFDVNRMFAGRRPRSSAANSRITLAPLFETPVSKHTSFNQSAAKQWDDWLDEVCREYDAQSGTFEYTSSKPPFISIADFNLAFGQKGAIGPFMPLFYNFIMNSKGNFIENDSYDTLDGINRMAFVTDGLFPPIPPALAKDIPEDKIMDLADPLDQPFDKAFLEMEKPSPDDAVVGNKLNSETKTEWLKRLGGVGCATLYDYLDPDRVPISLALPTTERIPMICGVQFTQNGNMALGVMRNEGPVTEVKKNDDMTREVEATVTYNLDPRKLIDSLRSSVVRVLSVFPFSRIDDNDTGFAIDGRLSAFFSTAQNMSLRTSPSDTLHPQKQFSPTEVADNGVINIELKEQSLQIPQSIAKQQDAVIATDFQLNEATKIGQQLGGAKVLLSITYKWTQTLAGEGQTGGVNAQDWTPNLAEVQKDPSLASSVTAFTTLLPFTQQGANDPAASAQRLAATMSGANGYGNKACDLYLNFALWLRIKDKNGDVVDFVPACLDDDNTQNGVSQSRRQLAQMAANNGFVSGKPYPLMRFDTDGRGRLATLALSVQELDKMAADGTDVPVTLWPQQLIVGDPRHNYAPENWFSPSGSAGGVLDAEQWVAACHCTDADNDGDIFMATSDAGYLQSKYELAMLPRFALLDPDGAAAALNGQLKVPGNLDSFPDSFGGTANGAYMWQTYDPLGRDEYNFSITNLPWVAGMGGFHVNPFSDSLNVLSTVFANTPLDWAHSSTNILTGQKYNPATIDAATFNKTYAWNAYSSEANLEWDEVLKIAGRLRSSLRSELRTNPSKNWETVWNDLGWYADNFLNIPTLKAEDALIWNADRKFFYGFWRECLAASQQLFLIFVRAEPTMMGGDGVGQIPPQLGARAVALVWRDPTPSKDPNAPHQTRILFYRQLE